MTMATDDPSTDEPKEMPELLRREAKDWVVHIATGAVTREELQAFARWRAQSPAHAEAYARAAGLWKALNNPLADAERVRCQNVGAQPLSFTRRVGRRALLGGAVAASAAAAGIAFVNPPFDLWPSLDEFTAQYRTGIGQLQRIALGDEASVELNTRTSVNLKPSPNANDVELISGETALAAKRKPITVLAMEGRTSAAEAQFTVRCEGAAVHVTCLTGAVSVLYRGNTATIVPRQQVTYGSGRGLGAVRSIDPEVVAGWRDGVLVFDNERLSQVVEEVNRYRPGRIFLVNAALGDRLVTGRFKIARLDAVLTQFQAVFDAKVTSLPGGFVLLG